MKGIREEVLWWLSYGACLGATAAVCLIDWPTKITAIVGLVAATIALAKLARPVPEQKADPTSASEESPGASSPPSQTAIGQATRSRQDDYDLDDRRNLASFNRNGADRRIRRVLIDRCRNRDGSVDLIALSDLADILAQLDTPMRALHNENLELFRRQMLTSATVFLLEMRAYCMPSPHDPHKGYFPKNPNNSQIHSSIAKSADDAVSAYDQFVMAARREFPG